MKNLIKKLYETIPTKVKVGTAVATGLIGNAFYGGAQTNTEPIDYTCNTTKTCIEYKKLPQECKPITIAGEKYKIRQDTNSNKDSLDYVDVQFAKAEGKVKGVDLVTGVEYSELEWQKAIPLYLKKDKKEGIVKELAITNKYKDNFEMIHLPNGLNFYYLTIGENLLIVPANGKGKVIQTTKGTLKSEDGFFILTENPNTEYAYLFD